MTRRLFTVASMLSLVLCIAVAVLWVRSYRKADIITRVTASYVASPAAGSTEEEPTYTYSARITQTEFSADSGAIFFYFRRSTSEAAIPDKEALDHWKTVYPIGTRVQRESIPATHDDYPFPYGRFTDNERTDFDKVGLFLGSYTLSFINGESIPEFRVRVIRIRAWLLLAVFAILPVARVVKPLRNVFRALRHRPGLCVSCGYDLRASTERCPECGTPIRAEAKA